MAQAWTRCPTGVRETRDGRRPLSEGHYGLLAPVGTPRPIIDRLNTALRALVETEQVKQRILTEGGDPLTSTPEEYAKDIDSEERKWGTLIKKLNLKVD